MNTHEEIRTNRIAKRERNEKKQQADYIEKAVTADILISEIADALVAHHQEAGGRDEHGNWGHNGDIAHVNSELAHILGFLTRTEK